MAELIRRKKRIDRGVKVRSDGIYAVSSLKELMFLLAPRLVLVVGLLLAPLIVPGLYWNRVICLVGVFGLLAISLDFLANTAGLVCLGMAFFVGVGGYLSGILNVYFGLPMALTMPVATVAGAFICTFALLPCLPLHGIYFAVVSLIYPLVAERVIAATGIFGGTDGITDVTMLSNIWVNQYIVLGAVLICTFALRRLVNEDIGLIFRGIKDNDQAIRASGMSIMYYKAVAVFITALMGCFAGAYLSHLYGWVGISLLSLDFSIFPLTAIVVGGPGTIVGALIGTLILVPVSELLRAFAGLRIIFYSMIIVFFIIYWREGILNWGSRKYEQFEHWVEV